MTDHETAGSGEKSSERQEEFGRLLDTAVDALLEATVLSFPDELPMDKQPITKEEFRALLLEPTRDRIIQASAALLLEDVPTALLREINRRRHNHAS